ncbi:DUF2188 domain-containing protein [Paenarthrobacter sp. GOM3]|uniref:DUF2188 domain-containing protein n=1 Tax=Paenarthrobacter sp. GOM3 TaxID=2782567 RepID=UPI001BA7CFFA|nr:DUF2188 domain-containing protein [Paenarthrobacter sp. GOM3]WOH20139.1 DUF2188 domain-containing protein [Paenarthrobacter sp. GOM3]
MASAYVVPNGSQWQIKVDGRVISTHNTQDAAHDEARKYLHNNGGGELLILGLNGQIRVKDTIYPAHDPRSSRG